MAEIIATGMPCRSISLAIVAPQRLQVPQVATKKQASAPPSRSSVPSWSPNALDLSTGVATPGIVNISGNTPPITPSASRRRRWRRGQM